MSYTFVSFLQCTLKLGNVTNLKALFHTLCQSRQIFPTCPCQKLKKKKTWKGLFDPAHCRASSGSVVRAAGHEFDSYLELEIFSKLSGVRFLLLPNFLFSFTDKADQLDMGYKDFGYMYSLYGDLVIFNSDDEALRMRNALHHLFRPEEVAHFMGEVELVSSRLLNSIEDKDIVFPYKLFKLLTTEVCLRLFLGLDVEAAKGEAASIAELTIAHWHGEYFQNLAHISCGCTIGNKIS